MLNPAFGTDVKQVAVAFLFDADESLSQREATFATQYAALLQGTAAPMHDKWVKGSHRVGLYVFHHKNDKKGTLEELIAPLIENEWQARWKGADEYLNTYADVMNPVKRKRSEWLKAQINVTGQFLFPGDPMSIVISKPKGNKPGLSNTHFVGMESQSLVAFLQRVFW